MKMRTSNCSATVFDPKRYIGVWHELASIPKPYERKCCAALAIYSLDTSRTSLIIDNYCMCGGRIIDTISGVATQQPGYNDSFRFRVKFIDDLLGTYWIYATDYEMFSIVSNQEQDCLWILSRNQNVTEEFKNEMLRRCTVYHLPTTQLVWRI